MTDHLHISGFILLFLGLAHLIFPRYFNWKEELPKLSLVNKQLMQVHTFFIALFVILNGSLNILAAEDLQAGRLGFIVSFGLAIFWGTRLLAQFFMYSVELWKGKVFETAVHIAVTFLWIYLSGIYFLCALGSSDL